MKVQSILDRRTKTNIERYGGACPLHSTMVYDKWAARSYLTRGYTTEDGADIKIQGYEGYLYDRYMSLYPQSILHTKGIKSIKWIDQDGRTHFYHPDLYDVMRSMNLECKSEYTLQDQVKFTYLLKSCNLEIYIFTEDATPKNFRTANLLCISNVDELDEWFSRRK